MKVLRTVCPTCSAESAVRTEEENLFEYEEDIRYVRCKDHAVSAEDRLVAAVFGETL